MLCYVIIIFCDGEILYQGIVFPMIDLSGCIIVTWKFSTTSQWFNCTLSEGLLKK